MLLFDLDGTVLTSDSTISHTTVDIIKRCKSEGYNIGFITARSKSRKIICLLSALPYDFIAFYNGAVIYAKKQLVESNSLPYQQATSILQKLCNDYPDVIIDINQESYLSSSTYNKACSINSTIRKTCSVNNLPSYDVQRIRLKSESHRCIPLKKYMTDESIFYHTKYGDAIIVHKKANKGYAAQKAAEIFNITLDQMIAFGDDTNDIDMIRIVGTGVAMGNANSSLKKIADYITETNDNNGIETWIIKHLFK